MSSLLPFDSIQSLKYYHGQIDRRQAECLLYQNGQFLIRSSTSNLDQLVLSCKHEFQCLHFIIYETKCQPKRFFFENESFYSVSELINHYVSKRIPITISSGAIITDPVNINHQECAMQFPNEYLRKLYSKISAIQLEESSQNPFYLRKLDKEKISEAILQNEPDVLAKHLLKNNLKFIGFNCQKNPPTGHHWLINSGLELMLLPEGTQIRKDLIVRHECLKYFVITTIFKESNYEKKLKIMKKWIEIANCLENSLGDHFGFGSVMCGLCFPKIYDSKIWKQFNCKYMEQVRLFENILRIKFTNHLNGENKISSNCCLPFLIQLCHISECYYIVNLNLLPSFRNNLNKALSMEKEYEKRIGLNNFSFDDIIQLTMISDQIINNLDNFERNARLIMEDDSWFESDLEEMFKTNFHIKFMFQKDDLKMNYEDFHKLELTLNE